MGEKIVVGSINKGLQNDRTAFVIDNDSFPTLINAYQWRGRVKRKRGTSLLGRFQRYIGTTDGAGALTVTILPVPLSHGTSVFVVGNDIFTDADLTATASVSLITNGSGTGTLNRTSGLLTISGSQLNTAVIFYPQLPVMGLEDLVLSANQFPGTLGFDTRYSYNITTGFPYSIYDVSFYKNPSTSYFSPALPGYVQKSPYSPVSWNGRDYQQFYTVNYQNALWATNGITEPFSSTNIGMQYGIITTVDNITAGPPALADLTFSAPHNLKVGDFVFINEVITTTGINFQTGYVTVNVNATKVTVEFPLAHITTSGTGGIAQYLTATLDPLKDCLRFYDGDPTGGSPPLPSSSLGWVNFCPPLSQLGYTIEDEPAQQYYLVGAKMIVTFKDRLLFIGPVIQTSAAGSQVFLQDTVIYSQNGTPFYTASFRYNTDVNLFTPFPPPTYRPLLVPIGQTAQPTAFWEDVTGFGGFVSAGLAQPINTLSYNEDVLILGFSNKFARFVYTSNDLFPFLFYVVNSELGSTSTFSQVTLDRGGITFGNYGIVLSSQTESQRIDLSIPDQIFQLNYQNNGAQRVCAQRDYINEWMYFTYPSNEQTYIFPNQTLLYNYRDGTWAIFNESYTTYGTFRESSGLTWAGLGAEYGTWSKWNEPWNFGSSTLFMPKVIAGNAQGYVIFKDQGTNESASLSIQNIAASVVTSPNHTLNLGDYIVISGVQGTIGSAVNGKVFSVQNPSANSFNLNPSIGSGTYLGGGVIQRMYQPQIQTKEFPVSWGMARKTRLGPQQYLFSKTSTGQITLQIFLSQQDNGEAYNFGPVIPAQTPDPLNDSLVYTDILYTCPESSNLGLTPANTNLQMVTANQQAQIWHRMNTSLIGDTVQIGFTLSDLQMRDPTLTYQFDEIELHAFILDCSPSMVLS